MNGPEDFDIKDKSQIWVRDFNDDTAIAFEEEVFRQYEEAPFRPILININSYGGDVHALFAMLDTMDAIRAVADPGFFFVTSAKGKAMSAGALLLSYGDYRFATKNTTIMIHQVVGGTWGSQAENKVQFSELERLNSKLLTILCDRCKIKKPISDLEKELTHDLHLSPEKALEFGIIDAIGFPKLVEKKVYDLGILDVPTNEVEQNASDRKANKKTSKNKSSNRSTTTNSK